MICYHQTAVESLASGEVRDEIHCNGLEWKLMFRSDGCQIWIIAVREGFVFLAYSTSFHVFCYVSSNCWPPVTALQYLLCLVSPWMSCSWRVMGFLNEFALQLVVLWDVHLVPIDEQSILQLSFQRCSLVSWGDCH